MIVTLSIITVSFVILSIVNVKMTKKQKESHIRFEKEARERLEELEKYGYTDIRELLDFLDKIKLDYKKYEQNR